MRGLPAVRDPMHTDANSPQLALYAISRYLRSPDPTWPANHHITGFFYLENLSYVPEPALTEFLGSGESPVVIGFSSVVTPDPDAITESIFSAVEQVGCRAVVQQGWSGLGGNREVPPNIYLTGFVQHAWLYPQASCIIHAGGCGSTGTGIRSGRPAVVVPHLGEQMVWAELLKSAGCAGDIVPSDQLTAGRLSSAIEKTLKNPDLYRTTAEMAEKVREEDGVARARMLLEELAYNHA
jgi:UDP:flavonoid glycosyltransferase YjiC (YdhE family)